MICKNCGGEYTYTDLKCPYCHSENVAMVNVRKQEILDGYDREAEQIKEEAELYPRKEARKRTKYILCGVGILFVLVVVVAVIVAGNTEKAVNDEYEEELLHTEKLEELFVAGDYAGMNAYMEEEELWGYDKYSQVCSMYSAYSDMLEMDGKIREYDWIIGEDIETWRESNRDYIVDILDDVNQLFEYYEEFVQDKVFLGNEDALEEIFEKAMKELECFGFTEEELAEFPLENENPKKTEMVEILANYFWELAQATKTEGM